MIEMEKFKTDFIIPLQTGVVETLKIQCSYAVEAKTMSTGNDAIDNVTDIASIIALTGKDLNGCIALCMPEKVYLGIMGGMFGEKQPTLTRDLEDGAGELLNIIFGHAKRVWIDNGYQIDKAIPTVAVGKNIHLSYRSLVPTIILPFVCADGAFHLEVTIKE